MQAKTSPKRPPLELLLGPSGSGKTSAAIVRFCLQPATSLLVVTTKPQAEWMAQRANRDHGVPAAEARSRILPWSSLVAATLRSSRPANRVPISRSFGRIILSAIVPAAIGSRDFLGKALGAPGFVSALHEGIREWKLAGAAPDVFGTAARHASARGMVHLARKLSDIERLFAAYDRFLDDNGLEDEEDGLCRAAALIRSGDAPIPLDSTRIIVHGFYRFTNAQRSLLRAIAERVTDAGAPEADLTVTLPWDERRPLLFAAPGRTLERLRSEFTAREVQTASHDGGKALRARNLTLLSARLFAGAEPFPDRTGAEGCDDPPIQIFEAPNPYVETELVAREFRRLHEQLKIPWQDFAVILRTAADYSPILSSVFERYGVPVAAEDGETCAQNPLLKTVLTLLDVFRYGWRTEDVLGFLKSSYTAPDRLDVDRLRKQAAARAVRAGREDWRSLARAGSPTRKIFHETRETRERAEKVAIQGAAEPAWHPDLSAAIEEMARFDEILNGPPAETAHFARVVREIVSTFDMEERIALGDPARAERDTAALRGAVDTLDALVRMARMRSSGPLTFEAFHILLTEVWGNTIAYPASEGDQVRVMEPHASRERPVRICAVMGLTERVFPRRITEDAFVRDEERRLLRDWNGVDLEEQSLRADDERFLFYLAVTAPAERLILSFPRAAHENDTLPSFFLDEVRAVFESGRQPLGAERSEEDTVPGDPGRDGQALRTPGAEHGEGSTADRVSRHEDDAAAAPGAEGCKEAGEATPAAGIEVVVRTLADVAPRREESAVPADVMLSACADLFDPQGAGAPRTRALDGAARIERLLRAPGSGSAVRDVLRSRNLPRLPVIHDAPLKERFATARPVFTVVELETYALCPFRYLLRHVWNVKADVEEMDSSRQSALMHSVLRRYFRKRRSLGEAGLGAHDPEQVAAELRNILSASLQEARLNAGPHQIQILRRRLEDDLMGFAIREVRYAERFEAVPTHFHLSFGRTPVAVPPDPLSSSEPLVIAGEDGQTRMAISGFIDRVDLDETGAKALIVEYEVGRPPEFAAIQRGQSLQMPIHMLAMERLFGIQAAGACYDSMQETGRRRFHRAEHVNVGRFGPVMPFDDAANVKPLSRDQYAELIDTAEASALRLAAAIANGRIEATPGTHCRGCDFRDVCRTTVLDGHDGERLSAV